MGIRKKVIASWYKGNKSNNNNAKKLIMVITKIRAKIKVFEILE